MYHTIRYNKGQVTNRNITGDYADFPEDTIRAGPEYHLKGRITELESNKQVKQFQ